jgi:hypothetical protein
MQRLVRLVPIHIYGVLFKHRHELFYLYLMSPNEGLTRYSAVRRNIYEKKKNLGAPKQ